MSTQFTPTLNGLWCDGLVQGIYSRGIFGVLHFMLYAVVQLFMQELYQSKIIK